MGYYDNMKSDFDKKCLENYEELKKFLMEDENKNRFLMARQYLSSMENKIKTKTEKINDYQKFFRTLKGLMPSDNSNQKLC